MSICISNIVISHPKNVTICEGGGVTFTCVSNITITDNDVMWYRRRKAYGVITTVKIIPSRRINYTIVNDATTTLTISNATIALIGFYWVKAPNFNACNVFLNVHKGTYVCMIIKYCYYIYIIMYKNI